MITEHNNQANMPQFVLCQVSNCTSKQICSSENANYCVDCNKVLCNPCLTSHDVSHCILENADINTLPRITHTEQPHNILPIINLNDFDDTPPNIGVTVAQPNQLLNKSSDNQRIPSSANIMYPPLASENHTVSFLEQLSYLNKHFDQEDSEEDDDDDEDEEIFKRQFMKDIKSEHDPYNIDSEDDSGEGDERMRIMMLNAKTSNKIEASSDGYTTNSNTSPIPSKSNPFTFNNNNNNNNNTASKNNNPSFLTVPQQQYQNLSISSLSINGQSSHQFWQSNSNSMYDQPAKNQVSQAITPLMEKIKQLGRYDKQMAAFEKVKPIPQNKIPKKSAKVLIKKKNRLNKDDYENEDDEVMFGDEIVIPDVVNGIQLQPSYDTKQLNELKNKAKKLFESIKGEAELIFKEAKPHIHGVQYARDEIDRVNKYKKYAMEGIDCYFLYMKDAFTIEYDKLKKCKKRNKLSRMLGKIVKIMDTFTFMRDPKEFVSFLNRDYIKFFDVVKEQLKEIQFEGNDQPPSFKIVYENLYDIFDSLLNFMSLNLSSSSQYNSFNQPIITVASSTNQLIPVFYPTKNMVALWNSSTSEIIEMRYAGSGSEDFRSYRNYEIVNDTEFIYFIGGQVYNEERNNFNPSVKCFKMSIRNGQIIPIEDLPYPKMKFGISLTNNKIYIFGGLQTSERLRSNTCESYDITSNTWSSLPRMQKNRVCPIQCVFTPSSESLIGSRSILIFTIGGMEDKNNINYSIEVFDTELNEWIEFIEKPTNVKCYIPKQLGYAIQVNPEQILIIGGQSGRKQKPTSGMQVYNVSKRSITNISLDSLPIGLMNDYHCGQPIIHNRSVFVLNTQISQYFPVLKQLEGVCNILKIGLNQQEIICTHVF